MGPIKGHNPENITLPRSWAGTHNVARSALPAVTRRPLDLHTCTQVGGARLGWADGADAQALVRGTWHVSGGIMAPLHGKQVCVWMASDAGKRTGSSLENGAGGARAVV